MELVPRGSSMFQTMRTSFPAATTDIDIVELGPHSEALTLEVKVLVPEWELIVYVGKIYVLFTWRNAAHINIAS